jgi:cell division protein ZipA
MLFTAERLAALLDGELQDESHSVLSKQTIEHMRGKILEHRRQVQLALSKR